MARLGAVCRGERCCFPLLRRPAPVERVARRRSLGLCCLCSRLQPLPSLRALLPQVMAVVGV
jgi:hypothetical protein